MFATSARVRIFLATLDYKIADIKREIDDIENGERERDWIAEAENLARCDRIKPRGGKWTEASARKYAERRYREMTLHNRRSANLLEKYPFAFCQKGQEDISG